MWPSIGDVSGKLKSLFITIVNLGFAFMCYSLRSSKYMIYVGLLICMTVIPGTIYKLLSFSNDVQLQFITLLCSHFLAKCMGVANAHGILLLMPMKRVQFKRSDHLQMCKKPSSNLSLTPLYTRNLEHLMRYANNATMCWNCKTLWYYGTKTPFALV